MKLADRIAQDLPLTTEQAAVYCGYNGSAGIQAAVRRGALRPDGKRGRTFIFLRETLDRYLGIISTSASVAPGERDTNGKQIFCFQGHKAARARALPGASDSDRSQDGEVALEAKEGEMRNDGRGEASSGGARRRDTGNREARRAAAARRFRRVVARAQGRTTEA